MALFTQKVWTDKQVQFPSRRKLTNVSTQEEKTVIVERNEGIIYEEGNLFDAAAVNDLEERVATAFNEIEEVLNNRVNLYYPVGKIFMAVTDLHLEDPNQEIFPDTTWVRLENRALLPVDPETQDSGVEGGSNTLDVTVSAKSISANTTIANTRLTVSQMRTHSHSATYTYATGQGQSMDIASGVTKHYCDSQSARWLSTSYTGGGSHGHGVSNQKVSFTGTKVTKINNMQKYITVYAWKRIG